MDVDPAEVLFIQFAREPVPGRVKTRMLSELTPEQACDLHRDLVLWTTRALVGAGLGPVELHITGDATAPLFEQCLDLGASAIVPQRGADLGERMFRALRQGLNGHPCVILVGSDCPQLDGAYLGRAVEALQQHEVVLGPAEDGGYVLIGARSVEAAWFEGVAWGSERVFEQTVERLEATGARWCALQPLRDIDRPEDLPLWRDIAGFDR